MTALRGLTWDHPRGRAPLAAAAERWAGEIEITWAAQPLEGFESTPIPELALSYDLIVLDHPHLGEAVAAGCLVPVADLLGDEAVARIAAATVGAAWLLDPATQTTFIPEHQGQPAARAAWIDPALDATRGFYSGTLRTTEAAWVRPRFPGYIEFQSRGSELIRDGLAERTPGPRLLDRLDALWRASLPTGAVL